MKDTLICIPTLNEATNIKPLLQEIFSLYPEINVVVLDDQSTDGTPEIVKQQQREYAKLNLIQRTHNKGYAKSYIDGFKYAIEHGFKWILQIDADFSHHPRYIKDMLDARNEAEVIIGSRYVKNGGVKNWPSTRKFLSIAGNLYSALWLGTKVGDMTGGFVLWNEKVLKSFDLNSIQSDGYCFNSELKYYAAKANFRIKEIPIIFEDRTQDKSKMSKKIMFEAIMKIPKLRFGK